MFVDTLPDQEAVLLGNLYAELSVLLQSGGETESGLVALVNEYGAEDVKWTLQVLSEDMGCTFTA